MQTPELGYVPAEQITQRLPESPYPATQDWQVVADVQVAQAEGQARVSLDCKSKNNLLLLHVVSAYVPAVQAIQTPLLSIYPGLHVRQTPPALQVVQPIGQSVFNY